MTPPDEVLSGFQMVSDHLERGILDGTFPAGTQLPPERELAAELGVSRGAVREAIRSLAALGIVSQAAGPRNGNRVSTGQSDAVARILQLHLALGASSMRDLTETRIALERSTAALAARHALTADLDALTALCAHMDDAVEPASFNDLDTAFHVLIARLSGNGLAADLTVAIRRSARSPILRAEQVLDDWPAFRSSLVAQHRAIADAIVAGRAGEASDLMDAHIRSAYAELGVGAEEADAS